MAKNQYLQIDSFSSEDTNELFEAICTDIAKVSVMDAKKSILELKMTEEKIKAHKCSLSDVLLLISFYDIPFKFRVEFLDALSSNQDEKKKVEVPNFESGHKIDPIKREMEGQLGEITNPDLRDVAKTREIEVRKDTVKPIDPNSIPDFKM